MGDMSEYYQEAEVAETAVRDAAIAQQARDCESGIWRSHDGRAVKIKEMNEHHLRNALAMLRRKGFIGPKTLAAYLHGPMPRGEMAQQAFSEELDEVLNAKVNPYIDLLEAEMARRGLKGGRP